MAKRYVNVLWFKPVHAPKQILGHYTGMDRAVADGKEFRERYLAKLPEEIRSLVAEYCVYWIEVMDDGLNLDMPVRFVRPIQTEGDKKRNDPECS